MKKITHRSFDFVDRCATEIVLNSERMNKYRKMRYNVTCYREQCPGSKLCPMEVGCLLCCCTFTVVSCFSQRINSFFCENMFKLAKSGFGVDMFNFTSKGPRLETDHSTL